MILATQSEQALELISDTEVAKLLSPQQQKIWEYIFELSSEFTPNEIAKKLDIPRVSVGQALDKLLKLKWVDRKGLGSGTRYVKIK